MNHIPAKTYGYASNKDVKFSKYKRHHQQVWVDINQIV